MEAPHVICLILSNNVVLKVGIIDGMYLSHKEMKRISYIHSTNNFLIKNQKSRLIISKCLMAVTIQMLFLELLTWASNKILKSSIK